MCGIAGIIDSDRSRPAAGADLSRMLGGLEHRGPDGEGRMEEPGACLGHRRLAIIDLSAAAAQPFPSEDGRVWSAVNGEIYNHGEIRRDLEARGHVFRSRCDAEVVVHLYEEHGRALVERIDGMFALAVWDTRRRRLLLARDRLGKKPLYYHDADGRIAFSSGIASLLGCPSVPNVADELALHHFLSYRFVPSPFTGFRGIRKLPPAHSLLWQDGRAKIVRYWAPPEPSEKRDGRAAGPAAVEEAARELRARLAVAVRRRLESDVPLGLLLSGGLDSSIIALEMARALGSAFDTFSVGFPGTEYDESVWAERVARQVGADHHAVRITPEVTSALPLLVRRYGEPFADSSAVAVEALARAVRPHVTVVLGGDGGDELFGGYDRYRALALSDLLRPVGARGRGLLAGLAARTIRGLPVGIGRRNAAGRALRFVEALALPPDERNEQWLACFSEEEKHDLYGPDLAGRMTGVESSSLLRCHIPPTGDAVARAMRADLLFQLPDRMLFKLDGATMSVGLEARCPFLDTALVEWVCGLPPGLKAPPILSGRGKPLLRRAYEEELPTEILRRKKAGFGLPVDVWLRGPLQTMARDLVASGRLVGRGLIDRRAAGRLVDEHLAGTANHDDRIWALLCLELWFREFIDRRPPVAHSPSAVRLDGGMVDSYLDTDMPRQADDGDRAADGAPAPPTAPPAAGDRAPDAKEPGVG